LQYTIESRELTSEYTHRPSHESQPRRTVVEAQDAGDAISQFVRQIHGELVSVTRPRIGRESIATLKKDDSVLLVRVYAA
jgi:hypothetical protein